MGGPCYFGDDKETAPDCTDNFQIVQSMFSAYGHEWHSIEQAFQALKFPKGSIGRNVILNSSPEEMEGSGPYGIRVWIYGRRGPPNFPEWVIRKNWDLEKVKVMYILNLAKYASNESFQRDLVNVTNEHRIIGQPSTDSRRHGKNWKFWNENIQTAIRRLVAEGADLHDVITSVEGMSGERVEEILMGESNED
jgi:predicted NAD-dependent protein-ADP-ribosyltransferase YbiA (DUF1768 family)